MPTIARLHRRRHPAAADTARLIEIARDHAARGRWDQAERAVHNLAVADGGLPALYNTVADRIIDLDRNTGPGGLHGYGIFWVIHPERTPDDLIPAGNYVLGRALDAPLSCAALINGLTDTGRQRIALALLRLERYVAEQTAQVRT